MTTRPPGPPPARVAPQAMFSAMALGLAIATILFQPLDAAAATAPRLLPDRDVKVEYTVTAPGRAPQAYDLSFSAESKRLRIDDPARGLWFLVDLRDASAVIVVPQMHVVVSEPDLSNLAVILHRAETARFTPLGEATIAGLRCTRYLVSSQQVSGKACLTRGGIALEVSGEDSRGSAEAIADQVVEAPVPPESLVPPPGFPSLALPPGTIAALLGQ
ncbi:MAG: hypothetical protein ACREE5_09270 [Acetobacteraceae bacterium]